MKRCSGTVLAGSRKQNGVLMLGLRARLVVLVLLAGTGLSVMNCTSPPRSLGAARLTEGKTIGKMTGGTDSAAVILADPADCLSCNHPLYALLQARQSRRGVVFLVLSRAPTDFERRQLALQHMEPDAVIRDWPYAGQFREPMVVTLVRHVESSPLKIVQAKPFIRALLREVIDTASVSIPLRR